MAAPSRRRFLGGSAAAVGVLAAGTGGGVLVARSRDVRPDPVPPPVVPAVLSAAIAREVALLQGLGAAAVTPGVAERTAAIVDDHTEHLRVLAVELARITGAPTIDSAVPSASVGTRAPRTLADELAGLGAAEAAAATDSAAASLAGLGADPALADLHVLLGTISASESVHAAMLR